MFEIVFIAIALFVFVNTLAWFNENRVFEENEFAMGLDAATTNKSLAEFDNSRLFESDFDDIDYSDASDISIYRMINSENGKIDINVDGLPMFGGIDIHGKFYGQFEDFNDYQNNGMFNGIAHNGENNEYL